MKSHIPAPVLFISHGAPTFALEPGKLGARLGALGKTLGDLSAVLVVSPHWQTRGVKVMTQLQPETVHDFGGFPAPLYALRYPAPGAPDVAREAARLLTDAGFAVEADAERGLDHGAWVPLLHLLPDAAIPVLQVSLPRDLNAARALEMGQALAALRNQGVAIVGSGSMTHNLHDLRPPGTPVEDYAVEFTHWVRKTVSDRSFDALRHYRTLAPHAVRAHPTEEHFLPLLVAIGATQAADAFTLLDADFTYGVLSMESYAWGVTPAP